MVNFALHCCQQLRVGGGVFRPPGAGSFREPAAALQKRAQHLQAKMVTLHGQCGARPLLLLLLSRVWCTELSPSSTARDTKPWSSPGLCFEELVAYGSFHVEALFFASLPWPGGTSLLDVLRLKDLFNAGQQPPM